MTTHAFHISNDSQVRPLFAAIAAAITARANCERTGNQFAETWTERLEALESLLPSGSGFDAGTRIEPKPDGFELVTAFHHMTDSGLYDGWTDHGVRVRPDFDGFRLSISGRNRDGIKEYIADTFAAVLRLPVRWTETGAEAVASLSASDHADAAASLWESVLEYARQEQAEAVAQGTGTEPRGPVSDALAAHGYAATRQAVADCAAACHAAWEHATRHGFDSCFDWEFCPRFAVSAMDWTDGLPRLRADYLAQAESIAQEMNQ